MTTSTLADIRTKVRRLTGRPSPQQITDTQIDEYVNTFYLYDFPEELRLASLETKFEFMTETNIDQYDMETMQVWNGATNENAVDVYINVKPPAYVAGYQTFWSQDIEQFNRIYPPLAEIVSTVQGDGTAGPYTVTLANTPILQRCVTVGAVDVNDAVQNYIDVPTDRTTGSWNIINTDPTTLQTGSINYITGALSVTFPAVIPTGNTITFTGVPYVANRPQAILFYDNVLTLRPVPDQSYKVSIAAYKNPTQFLSNSPTTNPQLKQWWQLLALGAAVKIFQDAQDLESAQGIQPILDKQLRLALRRTIVDRTQQRTATIYTEQTSYGYGNFNRQF